eukprot:1037094-Lingulodinium_polyedra.AAC.1
MRSAWGKEPPGVACQVDCAPLLPPPAGAPADAPGPSEANALEEGRPNAACRLAHTRVLCGEAGSGA